MAEVDRQCTVDRNRGTEQTIGMTAKAERMKSALAGLTPEDRAELVRFLIESLDGDEEQGVAAAWDEELKRRAEEIQSGRVTGEPAEKLLREMRAKYPAIRA
jgi:putative addiction module component (TIGR02574 family)